MTARIRDLLSRERELRMMWALEKGGRRSYLVGTAHFFPYHFRGSLQQHIGRVDRVVFEGPLDREAAQRVLAYGSNLGGEISLLQALDPQTRTKITAELGSPGRGLSSHAFYRHVLGVDPLEIDWDAIGRMRPWMAFFRIWSHYLRKNGWLYNIELDAVQIAADAGVETHFLETIEEQIEALDSVPVERIVTFLRDTDWGASRRDYVRGYLRGDLEGLMARARDFPTVCEAIVGKRDPILFARMRPFLEQGQAMVLVGTAHCPGITARLLEDGYRLGPPAGTEPRTPCPPVGWPHRRAKTPRTSARLRLIRPLTCRFARWARGGECAAVPALTRRTPDAMVPHDAAAPRPLPIGSPLAHGHRIRLPWASPLDTPPSLLRPRLQPR